jgi:hypothetical protein
MQTLHVLGQSVCGPDQIEAHRHRRQVGSRNDFTDSRLCQLQQILGIAHADLLVAELEQTLP